MRKVVSTAAVLLALVYCAVAGVADVSVTLEGNIVCAKCTLKVEGVDKCQSVLLVKNAARTDTQYWLARNAVAEAFGDVCTDIKPVTVTGSIEEKDGRKWIVATKIDPRRAPGSD
jgi:type 1 fimbria pilin